MNLGFYDGWFTGSMRRRFFSDRKKGVYNLRIRVLKRRDWTKHFSGGLSTVQGLYYYYNTVCLSYWYEWIVRLQMIERRIVCILCGQHSVVFFGKKMQKNKHYNNLVVKMNNIMYYTIISHLVNWIKQNSTTPINNIILFLYYILSLISITIHCYNIIIIKSIMN